MNDNELWNSVQNEWINVVGISHAESVKMAIWLHIDAGYKSEKYINALLSMINAFSKMKYPT